MNKIALISVYFGKFPQYFNLWLKSAENNKNIDFLIYGDCEYSARIPENVHLIKYTFDEIKEKIQSKFDFKITLDNPYKLCDYKPAYGYIFCDDLNGFDYWGHVDIDTILGDIEKFLPDKEYDKIYQLGHLCLYKNTSNNNTRFMQNGGQYYKDVFTTANITVFDEVIGMQHKYNLLNIDTYISRDYADITKRLNRFTLSNIYISKKELKRNNYEYQIFYYEDSKIFREFIDSDSRIKKQEFNYIHFSSRKMPDNTQESESFYITNKGFFPKRENVTKEIIEKYNPPSPTKDKITTLKWEIKDFEKKVKKAFTLIKEKYIHK